MLQQLQQEYNKKIVNDDLLKAKIAALFGKKAITAYRWAKRNHYNLTIPAVLDIIREHEGLSRDVELTEARIFEPHISL